MKFKKMFSFVAALATIANLCAFSVVHAEESYYDTDTMIAYADFELGGWSYLQSVEEVETAYSKSGTKAGKVSAKNADLRANGTNLKTAPTPVDPDTYFKVGNKYKISFYAATETDGDVYLHLMRNGSSTIAEWQKITKEMTYYSFIYEPVINTNTIPFIRTATDATYYIDDYLVEEVISAELISSTLPEDNAEISELGYKEYTLTFSKEIVSATVTGMTACKAIVSGNTVTISGSWIDAGKQTIKVDVVDVDTMTTTVSRSFSVADTMIAYADFELGGWSYLQSVEEVETAYSKSGTKAGKVSAKNADLRANGTNLKTAPTPVDPDTYFKVGNKYKISFYAATETDGDVYLHLMRNGSSTIAEWQKITKEMTYYSFIYEPVINTNTIPFIRTATDATYYIDDYLVEEVISAELISSTLPEDNAEISELGYKEYTLTFSKEIVSATVTGMTACKAIVSGNTVTISGSWIDAGEQTINVNVTDVANMNLTVTRKVVVADNLIAYADFENANSWSYLQAVQEVETELRKSGNHAGKVSAKNADLKVNGTSIKKVPTPVEPDTYFKVGNKYKISFYAATETDGDVYIHLMRNGSEIIKDWQKITKEMTYYSFEYEPVINTNTIPFIRTGTEAVYYIDDYLVEEINLAELVSSTLPEENEKITELGYKEYTLTFDRELTSATVEGMMSGKATVSGNTVTIRGLMVDAGEQTIKVTVTDTTNRTKSVTRNIVIADKLVAYTGFDTNGSGHSYMQNIGSYSSDIFYSGVQSGIVSSGINDIRFQQANWSKVNFKNDIIKDETGAYVSSITPGKKYKVSYYAYAVAEEGKEYELGIAQGNSSLHEPMSIIADGSWHYYEAEVTALQNTVPRFYRENSTGTIYIDDVLIQKVTETDDTSYCYSVILSGGRKATEITSGATYTARGYITNISENQPISGNVYFAIYKGNRLENVVVSDDLTANKGTGIHYVECDLTMPNDVEGVTIKAFLWDKNIKPLTMFDWISYIEN